MAKYVLMGKYSNEFSSAMVHTPQDRMDVVEPMLINFGVKLIEFLYIPNNPKIDPDIPAPTAKGFDELKK